MAALLSKQLALSVSLEQVATTMEHWLKGYGFAGYVYWTYLRLPLQDLLPGNSFVLARGPTHLKIFEALYLGKQQYINDPIVQYAETTSAPFRTRDIRRNKAAVKSAPKLRWLEKLERRFGYIHDINIPLHTPARIQVFCAFFLGDDPACRQQTEQALPRLQLEAALFASSVSEFVDLGGNRNCPDAILTTREQECLFWMAKGYSNKDISRILEISERTVKFHIRNIVEKLEAENRTHAVAVAARSGWISN